VQVTATTSDTITATARHRDGLRLRGVGAGYREGLVLADVDLDLPAASITGVVGPNGAGKSTLLRAVLGLAPIVVGSVTIDGEAVDRRRRRIAYVPQREAVDWSFPITAGDVVMMGRYPGLGVLRRPGRADYRCVADALDRVGMADLADRQIGALSGGQQQRVFLARALVQEATVLLLDEPMTGVDQATEQSINGLMEELRDEGATIVLTTHDLESASDRCDYLAFVNQRLIAFGPPAETFTPPILHATFGGELLILQAGDHRHVHAGGHHGPVGRGGG
jgi:ABC-type Mn2+/Zn2+ transport system ATPase subunit